MQNKRFDIGDLLKTGNKLTVRDFTAIMPEAPMPTIYSRIRALTKSGKIFPVAKGQYEVGFHMEYHPDITERMQIISDILQSEFINEPFCIHENGSTLFVEIGKNAVKKAIEALKQNFSPVLSLHQYHIVAEAVSNCIVVKNLITEAPIITNHGVNVPSLEKTLVDIVADQEFTLVSDDRIQFDYQKAFEVYRPDRNRMLRYASRRGIQNSVGRFIQNVNQSRVDLIAKIQNFLVLQPIDRAWVFGSFSRGEESENSDIDLLVEYAKPNKISLLDMVGIKLDLEKSISKTVDLIEDGHLLPFAIESANKDKYLMYERRS